MTNTVAMKQYLNGRVTPKQLFARTLLAGLLMLSAYFYLQFSPLFARSFYYQVIFMPSAYPEGTYEERTVRGVQAQDVYFKTSAGQTVHGWYFHKPGSKKLILMHHGNAGNVSILQWYVELALSSDASILTYDYEGYGKTAGVPSIDGAERDADAAYQFVTSRKGWKPSQIVNLGLSLGTGVASELAIRHPCAGVVLIAPYTSLRRLGRDLAPVVSIYPDVLWPEHDIGAKHLTDKRHVPILILHGEEDATISIRNSDELARCTEGGPVTLVKLAAGHGDYDRDQERMYKSFRDFLRSL